MKRLPALWTLVLILLLAHTGWLWQGQRIAPDSDILALLPVQERDPVLQQSFTRMVDAAQQRVLVLIAAPDWEQTRRASAAYRKVLAGHPEWLALPAATESSQTDWLRSFAAHRLLLQSEQQAQQLQTRPAAFWQELALSRLYTPFAGSGPATGTWQDDPFGLFSGWVQERAQETPVRPRDGELSVSDGKKTWVLLPLTVRLPAFSVSAQRAIVPMLEQARQAAQQSVPGVRLEMISAGVLLHAAAAGEQANHEVSTIGIGSLLGIVLLMWLTFRSLKPILLILLSIGVGCLGAFSVCSLLFAKIHLMTLVFSASLIGVAQDYGLYFLCNRLNTDAATSSGVLLKRILPGLVLTMVTTVIGYMALALTPFPGLRQMAIFSAVGLVFAWLTVICWFPVLAPGGSLQSGVLVQLNQRLRVLWPRFGRNRATLFCLGLFVLLSAWGCARLVANDDIRLLQNTPAQLMSDQIRLSQLLDAPAPAQYFLVRGESAESVLQREEALKARLAPLIAESTISGVQAISNWVPSLRTQDARRQLIQQKLLQPAGPLAQTGQHLEQDEAWFEATRKHLLAAGQPLLPDDFLRSAASEPWRHLWLGPSAQSGQPGQPGQPPNHASIVALRGLTPGAVSRVQQSVQGLPGVQWVDKVAEISSVLGRYRQNMGWVLAGAYVLVFALMFPRYRRDTWRVLLPTLLASIATLALFGASGQHLQLFHILALMLLLGTGVDYGIFMMEHPDQTERTPWLAVALSAINTILSFGLLALSQTPALRAFGLTILIGTALVWLIVPLFGKTTPHAH